MVNQPVGPVSLPVHTPPRLTSYRRLIHDLIQSWIVITVLNMKNGQRALYTLSTEYSEWTESSELCPLGVKSTLSGQSTHASSRKHTKEKKSETVYSSAVCFSFNSSGSEVEHFALSILKPLKRCTAAPPAGERMSVGLAELKNTNQSSPVISVLRRSQQC